MNRIKQMYKMIKVYNLSDIIYVYIPLLFACSIIYAIENLKWDIISFIPLFFIILIFMVGLTTELIISARYNILTTIPYKAENIIKDMFLFTEMLVLLVFIFDVIVNFCFGNIDVALAHLASLFICLFFNYIIISFTAESQMKISYTMTKRLIGIIICTIVLTVFSILIVILPYEQAGNTILRYIYVTVTIVFAILDIIFRKVFINKTIKRIRG